MQLERIRAAARRETLDELKVRFINAAMADGKGGVTTTAVKWWLKFTVYGRGVSPIRRVGSDATIEAKFAEEQLLIDFVLWLVCCRPSGKPILPETASKYVSTVKAWHERMFKYQIGGGIDLSSLRDVIKGMNKELKLPAKRQRFGVRSQVLAAAIGNHLGGRSAAAANWRAALIVAFCGLMRGAEFAVEDGKTFNAARNLTRSDVKFGDGYVVIMMRPAKKNVSGKTVPLMLGGGGVLLDPVAALRELFELDPVSEAEAATTPLFRSGTGGAFKVKEVRSTVKLLMQYEGLDPTKFGAHSLRIGGASAALAAGVDPALIRMMGRWSSDIYQIYCRMSQAMALDVSVKIGSTPFVDIESGFRTEELELLPFEIEEHRRLIGFADV